MKPAELLTSNHHTTIPYCDSSYFHYDSFNKNKDLVFYFLFFS